MITHHFSENTWVEIEGGCPRIYSKREGPIVLEAEDVKVLVELIRKSMNREQHLELKTNKALNEMLNVVDSLNHTIHNPELWPLTPEEQARFISWVFNCAKRITAQPGYDELKQQLKKNN